VLHASFRANHLHIEVRSKECCGDSGNGLRASCILTGESFALVLLVWIVSSQLSCKLGNLFAGIFGIFGSQALFGIFGSQSLVAYV